MTEREIQVPNANSDSCDPAMSRKEFIQKVVKGAAITGGLLAAPKVLDKFILPAYAAGASSCNAGDLGATGGFGSDVTSGSPVSDIITVSGGDSLCTGG